MKFYCRAVNKWCVTGTPMNTSLSDLKGQFSFLGIEDTPELFSTFLKEMPTCHNVSAALVRRRDHRYSKSGKEKDSPGGVLFTLRNIMMRHSIQMKSRTEQRSIMSLPPKVSFKTIPKFNPNFLSLLHNMLLMYVVNILFRRNM